jgi:gliding motility-associated-like protein
MRIIIATLIALVLFAQLAAQNHSLYKSHNSNTLIDSIKQAALRQYFGSHNTIINVKTANNFKQQKSSGQAFYKPSHSIAYLEAMEQGVSKNCIDSSFAKLFGLTGYTINSLSISHTKDDGILLYGWGLKDITNYYTGFIAKMDKNGNPLWIRSYTDPPVNTSFFVSIENILELSNGDILAAGEIFNQNINYVGSTLVTRLSANGDYIWQLNFFNPATTIQNGQSLTVKGITEVSDGSVILSGTTNSSNFDSLMASYIKLSPDGKIQWDVHFGSMGDYHTPAEGVNAFVKNGQVIAVGLTHGKSAIKTGANAISFITLDYATGKAVNKRFFTPDYGYIYSGNSFSKQFIPGTVYCTHLNNDHYIFSGNLYSDYMQNSPSIDHFGVVEFDNNFNPVSFNYTISSGVTGNTLLNCLSFDASGNAICNIFHQAADQQQFFATIRNNSFVKQRVVDYYGMSLNIPIKSYTKGPYIFSNDSGYVFLQSLSDMSGNSYSEIRKMHDLDSTSICMGRDTVFANKLPYNIIEDTYQYVGDPLTDTLIKNDFPIWPSNLLELVQKSNCTQKNACDTIKIHGDTTLCAGQQMLFTAYRNKSCGSPVVWNIDNSVVATKNINDTSVAITFANQYWNGRLTVSLQSSGCTTPLMDSLMLHVKPSGIKPNLGADTTMCGNSTIMLHAGNKYNMYQWQDGSHDSTFTVLNAGTYYVNVTDNCKNQFADTIIVSKINAAFEIKGDTIKCNKDSVSLQATSGFLEYRWSPKYAINNDTVNIVTVAPVVNTLYTVVAEKMPGCYIQDSIFIQVKTSPAIYLGADTTICSNSTLLLNAGSGFSKYQWNTGQSTPSILVSQVGEYVVNSIAVNGCISSDTLSITAVNPLPFFNLGDDTTLCASETIRYNFNISNATYKWNDGSTKSTFQIQKKGLYWLTVIQNGCLATDSIQVTYAPSPIVSLGKDTTLCNGSNYVLSPGNNSAYQYKWQDGSNAPSYTVTKPGIYSVTANLSKCETSDTIQVNYLAKPEINNWTDTTICKGQLLTLSPHVDVSANYKWQDGSGLASFSVTYPGIYTLTATNQCGSTIRSFDIVKGLCELMMPSAFTPNKDGLNDMFRVKYPYPVKHFKMLIYNRWGQKIFETSDMYKGWDGTLTNIDQPAGAYIWTIVIEENDGGKTQQSGTVILLR